MNQKWKNKTGTKTYFTWRNMRSRCLNSNHVAYYNYGGRGIKVCDEWRDSYDKFVEDMGESPVGMSLDRINNDGDYCKENCKWSTIKEQLNNQRRNRLVTNDGVTKTVAQWAEIYGLKYDTLSKRLDRMSPEKAFVEGSLYKLIHGTRTAYESYKCKCDLCKASNTKRHQVQREKRRLK